MFCQSCICKAEPGASVVAVFLVRRWKSWLPCLRFSRRLEGVFVRFSEERCNVQHEKTGLVRVRLGAEVSGRVSKVVEMEFVKEGWWEDKRSSNLFRGHV